MNLVNILLRAGRVRAAIVYQERALQHTDDVAAARALLFELLEEHGGYTRLLEIAAVESASPIRY